jgi:hypothetical protein
LVSVALSMRIVAFSGIFILLPSLSFIHFIHIA